MTDIYAMTEMIERIAKSSIEGVRRRKDVVFVPDSGVQLGVFQDQKDIEQWKKHGLWVNDSYIPNPELTRRDLPIRTEKIENRQQRLDKQAKQIEVENDVIKRNIDKDSKIKKAFQAIERAKKDGEI